MRSERTLYDPVKDLFEPQDYFVVCDEPGSSAFPALLVCWIDGSSPTRDGRVAGLGSIPVGLSGWLRFRGFQRFYSSFLGFLHAFVALVGI